MARPKKDGKRATGIQAKKGKLYLVVSNTRYIDNKKKVEKIWISTGLIDTPENVKKAIDMRTSYINKSRALDPNMLMGTYIQFFLEKRQREVADTTYSAYFYKAKKIIEYMEYIRVRDVKKKTIENFLDDLFLKEGYKPRTVKDAKALLSNIFENAQKDGLIAENPVKNSFISKSLIEEYSPDKNVDDTFFSYEEAKLFLDRISAEEYFELYYIILFFGLRRGEALGLRWSSLDFDKKIMKINHTITKGTKINRLNRTKTLSSEREYPLSDEQVIMFMRLKRKEEEDERLQGNCYVKNEYVFKRKDGKLLYPDYVTKKFKKIISKIPELPQNITLHGLRRSCVSILVHEGVDVKSIQNWVGHKDLDTTLKIYAQVKEQTAKNEISLKMSNLLQIKNEIMK